MHHAPQVNRGGAGGGGHYGAGPPPPQQHQSYQQGYNGGGSQPQGYDPSAQSLQNHGGGSIAPGPPKKPAGSSNNVAFTQAAVQEYIQKLQKAHPPAALS